VEGVVTERRSLVLGPADVGIGMLPGEPAVGRSRVVLSGVMLITSSDATRDLSGLEVRLKVSVNRNVAGTEPQQVLGGEVLLAGGPSGAVEIVRATGAFSAVPLSVVDLAGFPDELPLLRAILFTGLELFYEYDVTVGEPFDLELFVQSRALASPGGTGAFAVFGIPEEGLGSVFTRLKRNDLGQRLSALIAQQVDTTGQAYADGNGGASLPALQFFPFCGMVGLETTPLVLMGLVMTMTRAGRRWRAREQHGSG
jgi:hypothetical protein